MLVWTGLVLVRVARENDGRVGAEGQAAAPPPIHWAVLRQSAMSPPSLGRRPAQSCLAPKNGQVPSKLGSAEVTAGTELEPTIYKYIYSRVDRRQYIVRREGYEVKTARTLTRALRVAMELFGCTREDLLSVASVGVKRRPAATTRSSCSLGSLGSDGGVAATRPLDACSSALLPLPRAASVRRMSHTCLVKVFGSESWWPRVSSSKL